MGEMVAGFAAAALTLFDLDITFYIPKSFHRKLALYAWSAGFILANAGMAIALYKTFHDLDLLAETSEAWRGFAIGFGYSALARLKFTNLTIAERNIPFGIELFYEGAKSFVYRRINRIAKDARYTETEKLANATTLRELGVRARLAIEQDALLSPVDRAESKKWLLRVLKDAESDEGEKKLLLANFVLSGQRAE